MVDNFTVNKPNLRLKSAHCPLVRSCLTEKNYSSVYFIKVPKIRHIKLHNFVTFQMMAIMYKVLPGFNEFGFNESSRSNESVITSKLFYFIKNSDLTNIRV